MENKKMEIGAFEAKTHLSELLQKAQAGEKIIITRRGKPVAELGPVPAKVKGPRLGFAKGLVVSISDDFDAPLDEFKDYM